MEREVIQEVAVKPVELHLTATSLWEEAILLEKTRSQVTKTMVDLTREAMMKTVKRTKTTMRIRKGGQHKGRLQQKRTRVTRKTVKNWMMYGHLQTRGQCRDRWDRWEQEEEGYDLLRD